MFNIQSTHSSILAKAMLVIVCVVWSSVVSAAEPSYIYASDIIQGQRNINSKQEIWQYQHEIPLTFQNNETSFQPRYTYLPPTQKVGSNPFSNYQQKYQVSLNNGADNHSNVAGNALAGNIYHYPPPIQKIGSNPFIKAKHQYVIPYDISQSIASSCDCGHSNYQSVVASY